MATEIDVRHDFDCDVETYWRTFFDEAYNAALYRELKMRERTVIEHTEEGDTIRRVIRLRPDVEVPGVLKKVAGDDLGYVERSTWSRAGSRLSVTIESTVPSLRDRFALSGTYTVAPAGAGERRVRREFRARLDVKVPLFGGQIEKLVAAEIRKSYETTTEFTRRWLREHAS